jgi:hypothetical protein
MRRKHKYNENINRKKRGKSELYGGREERTQEVAHNYVYFFIKRIY